MRCRLPACRWRQQLEALKRRWAGEQLAADKAWAARLEEQHNKWLKVGCWLQLQCEWMRCACLADTAALVPGLQERQQLEEAAAARLDAAEAAAAAAAAALRSKLQGRASAIEARLLQLATQEAAREAQRQELAAQVDALMAAGADEAAQRRSLEATLRKAAGLFRRELAAKSDEVAALQGQLRGLRHELAAGACSSSGCSAAASRPWGSPPPQPAAAAAAGGGHGGSCSSSPLAVAGGPAAGAARDAGAAVLAAELHALRASRVGFQEAVLQQQAVRNSLLSSLGDRLEVRAG